jgi:hypothetical protein
MVQQLKARTTQFRWQSRVDLYDYFKHKYSLSQDEIDEQIDRVMESFRPRKGKVIHTVELWQKVGMSLETALGGLQTLDKIDNLVVYEIAQIRTSGNEDSRSSLPPQPQMY